MKGMGALDRLIPEPRLRQVDSIEVAASPRKAWDLVRHADLGRSPFVRALFALRALPARFSGEPRESGRLCIDDITRGSQPGFRVLDEREGHHVTVGAIGPVWHPTIDFVDIRTAEDYARFADPGQVKVAWEVRVEPRGDLGASIAIEVRVTATDEDAWRRFRRYFRLIGPGSRYIRHVVLSSLLRELGGPDAMENERPLSGDELLPDGAGQMTHAITIRATPEAIWPWLVQMGCRRAGWYSHDLLDNAGIPSAKKIHPEWQHIAVGDIFPATPEGKDGFEVVRVDAPRVLVLGGLFVPGAGQIPFASPRPARYWHVTWAFVLEPLDAETTRLHVRVRGAFSSDQGLRASWIRPVHRFMQVSQLKHLAERAEGRAA